MSRVVIRNFNPVIDSGFIYSTYPKGVYHGSYDEINKPKDEWFKEFYQIVKAQVEHCYIVIACMEESPEVIIGYAIIGVDHPTRLEFVYVKEMFRNQGIGTLLVKGRYSAINRDHLTCVGHSILLNRPHLKEGRNHGTSRTEEIVKQAEERN